MFAKLNDSIRFRIILLMAGLMTITPTLLISMLASTYYYLGIKSLFNEKIANALVQTVEVAKLYAEEYNRKIETDILKVAQDISVNYFILGQDPKNFDEFWEEEYRLRLMPEEAKVFTKAGVIISKTPFSLSIYFEKVPPSALEKADAGEVVLLPSSDPDKIRAVMKLHAFDDLYLMVGKRIDRKIMDYLESSQGSQKHYEALLADVDYTEHKLQIAFLFLSIALCVASLIIAVRLAKKIATPINNLADATALVRDGNFAVRVPEHSGLKEIAILARAFNQMTRYIEAQTSELKQANNIIDERRRFIEAVLKEISSGLLVISPEHKITLCNPSALRLLQKTEAELLGSNYQGVIGNIADLIAKAGIYPGQIIGKNVEIQYADAAIYVLVRVATEVTDDQQIISYIVTIDDMTDLIAAQKQAAWGEVARRIAHEIKNPLTPITLSSERLLRKFLPQIHQDSEQFKQYIATIIHHVEDIGNIVEDFVNLARVQSMRLGRVNLYKLVEEFIFSQQITAPHISFVFESVLHQCWLRCDKTQISQVLINLLKNAIESINGRLSGSDHTAGTVVVRLIRPTAEPYIELQIIDNGCGVPENLLPNICDPYVTTKEGGTGLGLSIVSKIIEDHKGLLRISNNGIGVLGARITVLLPVNL